LRIIPTAAPDWAALQPDGRRRAVPRCWVSGHNGDIATRTAGLMSYAADYADTFRQAEFMLFLLAFSDQGAVGT
jgi:hypothetical protein